MKEKIQGKDLRVRKKALPLRYEKVTEKNDRFF